MFSEYQLGMLYGGGRFIKNHYKFYTLHEDLYDYMLNVLNYHLVEFEGVVASSEKKFKASIEIRDEQCNEQIREKGFLSEEAADRIHLNPDFLRGYLESNGSFYSYIDKGRKLWRCTFSGNLADLELIKKHFDSSGIKSRNIEERKPKNPNGNIFITYRLSIGARNSVTQLVNYLQPNNDGDISVSLSEKFDEFQSFDRVNPQRTNKEFTKTRFAVEVMCRALGLDLEQNTMQQPHRIYIGSGNDEWEFFDYKEAYDFVSALYEEHVKDK